MTYAEHHIGELHEFRVTPLLLENLAHCIERDCQLPTGEGADTPELLILAMKRRAAALNVAVHRILLTIMSAEPPVLDTAILASVDSLRDHALANGCIFDTEDALTLR